MLKLNIRETVLIHVIPRLQMTPVRVALQRMTRNITNENIYIYKKIYIRKINLHYKKLHLHRCCRWHFKDFNLYLHKILKTQPVPSTCYNRIKNVTE